MKIFVFSFKRKEEEEAGSEAHLLDSCMSREWNIRGMCVIDSCMWREWNIRGMCVIKLTTL